MGELYRFVGIMFLAILLPSIAAEENGQSDDEAKKFPVWRKAAQEGDPDSQYNVGRCYLSGIGVATDEKRAFACFKIAATSGHAAAQYALGECYANGWGISKDAKAAATWQAKAAANGFIRAPHYITSEDVKAQWLASLPQPRTMDRDYSAVIAKNLAFRDEVGSGKHDQRARQEAATHNKTEAARVGDKQKELQFEKELAAATPDNSPLSPLLILSEQDTAAIIRACEGASFFRQLNVSFEGPRGWTAPVTKTVTFLNDAELEALDVKADLRDCGIIRADKDTIIIAKLESTRVHNQLSYLFAFIPTGCITAVDRNAQAVRKWKLAADWPAPVALHGDLRVGVMSAAKKDDRATAAEFKMMLGDKEGCMAQLRILKRDFLRADDRVSASMVDLFLSSQH